MLLPPHFLIKYYIILHFLEACFLVFLKYNLFFYLLVLIIFIEKNLQNLTEWNVFIFIFFFLL